MLYFAATSALFNLFKEEIEWRISSKFFWEYLKEQLNDSIWQEPNFALTESPIQTVSEAALTERLTTRKKTNSIFSLDQKLAV